MTRGWMQQEAGWWTKMGRGGVCQERNGLWYFYPSGCACCQVGKSSGYKTMRACMAAADRRAVAKEGVK